MFCKNVTPKNNYGRQLNEPSHDELMELIENLELPDDFFSDFDGTRRRLRYNKLLRATIEPFTSAENGIGGLRLLFFAVIRYS